MNRWVSRVALVVAPSILHCQPDESSIGPANGSTGPSSTGAGGNTSAGMGAAGDRSADGGRPTTGGASGASTSHDAASALDVGAFETDEGNDGLEAAARDGTTIEAATTDGTSADAARIDATPDGGCPSPALVCDDFESGGLTGWKVLETGGVFAVDQMHAYGGRSSVKLTIPPNQRGGFLERTGAPLFPLVNNTNWGRMMIFFESMASLHFDTIRAAPLGGGTPWYNLGGQNNALLFNYYSGDKDCAGYPRPSPPIPKNRWMCWEWKFDGSKNELDLWIDGTLIWTVVNSGSVCVTGGLPTWAAPTFGSIRLGEFNAQTEGSQTRMWMDDIALGTSDRIGCPATPVAPH